MSRYGEPLQLSFDSYQEAAEGTLRSAKRAGVDVWYTIDGVGFDRIATFRPVAE
ncbi:MAG TPA: hypothetical protein VLV86_04270 [Vicinamibacterales bacterium]|nr:hypothetical protein [Vicinamibacterales bacterium]